MVKLFHRYLSLGLLLFWMLQAVSGVILTFHREVDAFGSVAGEEFFTPKHVGDAVKKVQMDFPTHVVRRVLIAGGLPGQIDVYAAKTSGQVEVFRIDGRGEIIRVRPFGGENAHFFEVVYHFHRELLAGESGEWVIGVSGLILAGNIILAVLLAWPRKGRWLSSLLPSRRIKLRSPPGLYAWHRAVGLWLTAPLLIMSLSGAGMVWSLPLWKALGQEQPQIGPSSTSPDSELDIGVEAAFEAAREVYPEANLSIIEFPQDGMPGYGFRLLMPGELRRIYGRSEVLVDNVTGEVLMSFDASKAEAPSQAIFSLYALHTGEALGLFGRIIALGAGLSLVAVIVFGFWMWLYRKRIEARVSTKKG